MLTLIKTLAFQVIDDIEAGNCNASEENLTQVCKELIQLKGDDELLTKEEARILLGISRATFDRRVLSGELPKGLKRSGVKELFWIKSSLKASK